MDVFSAVREIFANCVECFLLYCLFTKQLGHKKEKRKRLLLLLTGVFAAVCVADLAVPYAIAATAVIFIIKSCYSLAFDSRIIRRIIYGCIGASISLVGIGITALVLSAVSGCKAENMFLPQSKGFAVTMFYCTVTVVLYWVFTVIKPKGPLKYDRIIAVLTAAIMLICIISSAFALSAAAETSNPEELSPAAILCSFMFAAVCCAVLFFEKAGKTAAAETDKASGAEQFYLERENNSRVEKMIKIWRHDFHNYLEVLQIYIEKKDYEQLKKYLGETKKDFQQLFAISATGNSAVDAIISSKLMLANNKKIEVGLHIQQLGNLPLSETKMCVLLGNLIDNAIEACERIISETVRKYIDITIKIKRGMLMIRIENSSNSDFRYDGDKLISSKTGESHGYGIERIKQIVNEADGMCEIKPGNGNFIVSVIIPLQ